MFGRSDGNGTCVLVCKIKKCTQKMKSVREN
nr:MAG TPA: hypothetical protein [Caudoviricetes sp.]